MSDRNIIKSISDDQSEILNSIIQLYCSDGFDADITYGNGCFYKKINKPKLKFDIEPQYPGVIKSCSSKLPIKSCSINSVVFDPPFLTYIRQQRTGNGKMIMSNRFSGYWTYKELSNHYISSIIECNRVLKEGGILVFKCQDIIHNHKMHCTHNNVIQWATNENFILLDLFVLRANHRLPFPNKNGKQKHARIYHSYFLVFQKKML